VRDKGWRSARRTQRSELFEAAQTGVAGDREGGGCGAAGDYVVGVVVVKAGEEGAAAAGVDFAGEGGD
jgi:hypothetical protein